MTVRRANVSLPHLTSIPRTATKVVWVDTAAKYGIRSSSGDTDHLLAIRPHNAEQARLWQTVLEIGYGDLAPLAPGVRLVLSWDDTAQPAANYYARLSKSRHRSCGSADEMEAEIRRAPEPYILVISWAGSLRAAVIARISACAHAANKSVGFLCGRTAAGVSFAVAKALLSPVGLQAEPPHSDYMVFDAPSHRQVEKSQSARGQLRERLVAPSAIKVLRTHGEGGHAKLPGVVVCGLLDQAEFPHACDQGCSRHRECCKRANAAGADVIFGGDIRSSVLCFVCCNGFTLAGELYPSPVSIALSLIEGWVGAVIAPTRPLVAPDSLLVLLHDLLTANTPLGLVVAKLNEVCRDAGQNEAFALHGDPQAIPLPAHRGEQTEISGEQTPTSAAPTALTSTCGAIPDDFDEFRRWLVATINQSHRGARILRAIRCWLGEAVTELTTQLQRTLTQIEELAVFAAKGAEWNLVGEARTRLLRTRALVQMRVSKWDQELAKLCIDIRDRIDVFDLCHYDQILDRIDSGKPCLRCESPRELYFYGAHEPPEQHRLATLCRVCGPVSEHRVGGLTLTVAQASFVGQPGDTFDLTVELSPALSQPIVRTAQLCFAFFDKANDQRVHVETRTIDLQTSKTSQFTFDLQPNLGVDLHSIRIVATCGFDIAYARSRFAAMPEGTELQ